MDPNAATFVAKAVATTTALGVVTGSAVSFARRMPAAGISMGVNSGIAGALFFGSREFLVSPILTRSFDWSQYTRRREQLAGRSNSAQGRVSVDSVHDMRTNRLLDSGLSGAFTGAVLHVIMRGRLRLLSGALTGGLITTSLQFATNEVKLARIRYLSGGGEAETAMGSEQATTYTTTPLGEEPFEETTPRSSPSPFTEDQRLKPVDRRALDPSDPKKPRSFSERILDVMSHIVPIKKLTPDEYTVVLERKRLEDEQEAAAKTVAASLGEQKGDNGRPM